MAFVRGDHCDDVCCRKHGNDVRWSASYHGEYHHMSINSVEQIKIGAASSDVEPLIRPNC